MLPVPPRIAPSLLLAIAALGCEPPSSTRAPIVDGTRETGEPAVVLVTPFGAVALCTGTLIADNVVLTAKHCVQPPNADAPYPVTALSIGVGSQRGATEDYLVRYVDTTPGVYTQSPTTGLGGAITGVDIGVMILRQPVPGATPIAFRRDRPNDMIGQEFTAIGFGERPDGPAGLKFKGAGTLNSITGGVLFTEQTICSGDSGGPAIQELPTRQIIGVASFGQAGACPSAIDGYNSLYNQLDLIDRALFIAGHCSNRGPEECNSIDDNCDGEVDEGCAAVGATCAVATECAGAQHPAFLDPLPLPVTCTDLGAGLVCARLCDPLDPAGSCADGQHCRATGDCAGICAPGGPGSAIDGAACSADTDCASLLCADPGDGNQRCLTPCRSATGTCPVEEVCVGIGGACGGCVDGAIVSGARSIGEPCNDDSNCGTDLVCIENACAPACGSDGDCVAGYRCEAARCVRGMRGGIGDLCEDDADCAIGQACLSVDGHRTCAPMCATAEDCGEGFDCVMESGDLRCAPTLRVLGESCGNDAECLSGMCDGECVAACGPSATCSVGFECGRDSEGRARCISSGGGCSASASVSSASGPAPVGWLGLLGMLFGVRLFRRAR